MNRLFADGTILDAIIAAMVLEAVGLALFFRLTGRGVAPGQFLANLASGLCVVVAMRLALAGAWWGFTSASLLAALGLHLAELGRSWRR